ncbi:Ca(2+)/calmodulin-responsive adenylate cyclase, partial [Gryllus bimaculatus]
MEEALRVLFLWRSEAEEQRERAADIRRRNEALVYNILPPHVAAHFMGSRKRQHEELYSQSYAEVGVLFASMPNFSDFYSEETVNNQGLECLRFLNEVISDFDALLEEPKFQDIIKIKTIGSTYMAASGLNPSRQMKADDPVEVRWAHLSLLVEFALELKRALQGINEQSFNHFVLKMGDGRDDRHLASFRLHVRAARPGVREGQGAADDVLPHRQGRRRGWRRRRRAGAGRRAAGRAGKRKERRGGLSGAGEKTSGLRPQSPRPDDAGEASGRGPGRGPGAEAGRRDDAAQRSGAPLNRRKDLARPAPPCTPPPVAAAYVGPGRLHR